MTIRTTSSTQRLDMMLAQAEGFVRVGLPHEATARAKQVIAYAARAVARGGDLAALGQRRMLAEGLMQRLGKSARDAHGELKVTADDATHPTAWSE